MRRVSTIRKDAQKAKTLRKLNNLLHEVRVNIATLEGRVSDLEISFPYPRTKKQDDIIRELERKKSEYEYLKEEIEEMIQRRLECLIKS